MAVLRRVAISLILVMTACGESVTGTIDSTPTTSIVGVDTTVSEPDEHVSDQPQQTELPAPGYSCLEHGASTIDAATLEDIEDWEPAPEAFTSALALESGRPMSELGDWVTWPQAPADPPENDMVGYGEPIPLYVLTAALSVEPLVLLTSYSEPGLFPCEVAYVEYSPDFGYVSASPVIGETWCEVTDGQHGPSVVVYGVGSSAVPIRILVEGVETQSGTTMGPTRHVDYLTPLFREVGWPVEEVVSDIEEPARIASFARHLAGEGADGPVEIRASLLGPDGWVEISCGSGRMITVADVDITCSVDLVDGVPRIAAVGVDGLSTIRRQEAELTFPPGMVALDFAAPRGELISYSIEVLVSGSSVTADCGSVDVPTVLDVGAALALTREVAAYPAGPYVYWEYAFICPGCDTALQTTVFFITDAPPVVDRQPEGHPGLLSPFTVRDYLIEAVAAGSEVSVEFLDYGRIGTWEVDGVGIRTSCLIADTLPPELGATYCNYAGD